MNIKKTYAVVLKIITKLFGIDAAKKFDTKLRFKRSLNLKNPKSLADKVTYLELHGSTPLISKCTDKWEVRNYLRSKGCEDILVPSVGGPWKRYDDIEWDNLPNSFVLKATHGCKMNYFVKKKSKIDYKKCKMEIQRWLNTTYGTYSIEPHYYSIPHRFYAEEYLGDISGLVDYKFHCFDGEPQFIIVITDRKANGDKAMNVTINLLDLNWNPINEVIGYGNEKPGDGKIPKPDHFEDMVKYARILSKDFKFVRVDMYDREGGVLFGELTFTPAACVFPYLSEKFLDKMGKKLIL